MQRDKVILVNDRDEWIGIAAKDTAHREGLLHRAISVFITNDNGELLLQQRAAGKYHSGGLWSNACCTHPVPKESTRAAARRRLQEELGITTTLEKITTHYYFAEVSDTMHEHELDHVFGGIYNGDPQPDPAEVQAWRWISDADLSTWMAEKPHEFTVWFPMVFTAWSKAGIPVPSSKEG